jgi:hypothetical protein
MFKHKKLAVLGASLKENASTKRGPGTHVVQPACKMSNVKKRNTKVRKQDKKADSTIDMEDIEITSKHEESMEARAMAESANLNEGIDEEKNEYESEFMQTQGAEIAKNVFKDLIS